MLKVHELTEYLTDFLQTNLFKDYCPNGLQVQGQREISKIVTGVTASRALLEAAIAANADAILVHHGIFWKGDSYPITDRLYERVRPLIQQEVHLLAYHLPLDAHPVVGNNIQLAHKLGFESCVSHPCEHGEGLLWVGECSLQPDALAMQIERVLGRAPLHIAGRTADIKKVAWCTGAAQSLLEAAAQLGVDAYITGEASERTFHEAKELGVHFYGAGHHATERYGVQALGAHLAEKFSIAHQFIDIENPI
ncbi:MAG: Nif3-like dinuclear metal center hexameric protein [Legionellales bacterium]|nr:Nif3-like dinuclear metal center hexameric protein [Legionellales bacterium]|tara:strand:- start:70 stop:822 length:753 start_codon:yes stop_codon:yes gene_type:complete